MDISLYYQSYGNGFPLVLLHGNGGDSNYFAQQVPIFPVPPGNCLGYAGTWKISAGNSALFHPTVCRGPVALPG